MAKSIVFSVTNDVPGATVDHVLVFIKPKKALNSYLYYAWQDLNPSQGATIVFEYRRKWSVAVEDPSTQALSAQVKINPGQRFSAINPSMQSPYIDGVDINSVEPEEAAVLNSCTTPPTSIVLYWYNMSKAVVCMGTEPPDSINVGKTTLFEADEALYFLSANPEAAGPDYGLYVFSDATPYIAPKGTEAVGVRWYRDTLAGRDQFEFTPPSASSKIL